MTWFKVDDSLAFHPKALAAGNEALGLWVRAGSWSSQQLTEGHVPASVVELLGSRELAGRLVDAGLWVVDEGDGWRFHEWDDRNPSRDEALSLREKRAAAGRIGGQRSGAVRRARSTEATGEANSKQTVEAQLNPDPSQPSALTRTARARERQQLDDRTYRLLKQSGIRNPSGLWQTLDDDERTAWFDRASAGIVVGRVAVCGEHSLPEPCIGCAADRKVEGHERAAGVGP